MKSNYDRETRLKYFMTLEQEYAFYNEVLERIIQDPRKYLDNLDKLDVFEVSFIDYMRPAKPKKRKAL